jgi:hypothetical protein
MMCFFPLTPLSSSLVHLNSPQFFRFVLFCFSSAPPHEQMPPVPFQDWLHNLWDSVQYWWGSLFQIYPSAPTVLPYPTHFPVTTSLWFHDIILWPHPFPFPSIPHLPATHTPGHLHFRTSAQSLWHFLIFYQTGPSVFEPEFPDFLTWLPLTPYSLTFALP